MASVLDVAGWNVVVANLKSAWHLCVCCGDLRSKSQDVDGAGQVPFVAWLDGPEGTIWLLKNLLCPYFAPPCLSADLGNGLFDI